MNDIVKMLRFQDNQLDEDAANEIERLQEALDGLLPFAEWLLSDMTKERNPNPLRKSIEAARAALAEEKQDG